MQAGFLLEIDRQGLILNVEGLEAFNAALWLIAKPSYELTGLPAAEATYTHFQQRAVYYNSPFIKVNRTHLEFVAMPVCNMRDLFYTRRPDGGYLISDELFRLVAHVPQLRVEPMIHDFFMQRNTVPAGKTLFAEILRFKPFDLWTIENGFFCAQRPLVRQNLQRKECSSYEFFKKMLTQTIAHEVAGHERVALMYSGGVDSTLLGLILDRLLGRKVVAFAGAVTPDNASFAEDITRAERNSSALGWELKVIETNYQKDSVSAIADYPKHMPLAPHMVLVYKSIAEAIAKSGLGLALCGQNADTLYQLGATEALSWSTSSFAAIFRRFFFSDLYLQTLGGVKRENLLAWLSGKLGAKLGGLVYARLKHESVTLPRSVEEARHNYIHSRDEVLLTLKHSRPAAWEGLPEAQGSRLSSFQAFQLLLDHKITEYLMGGVSLAPHVSAQMSGFKVSLPYGSELMAEFFMNRQLTWREVLQAKPYIYRFAEELEPGLFARRSRPAQGANTRHTQQSPHNVVAEPKLANTQQWYKLILHETKFGSSLQQAIDCPERPATITNAQYFNLCLNTYWRDCVLNAAKKQGAAVHFSELRKRTSQQHSFQDLANSKELQSHLDISPRSI